MSLDQQQLILRGVILVVRSPLWTINCLKEAMLDTKYGHSVKRVEAEVLVLLIHCIMSGKNG